MSCSPSKLRDESHSEVLAGAVDVGSNAVVAVVEHADAEVEVFVPPVFVASAPVFVAAQVFAAATACAASVAAPGDFS